MPPSPSLRRDRQPPSWRPTPCQAVVALLIAGGAAGAAQAQSRAFSPAGSPTRARRNRPCSARAACRTAAWRASATPASSRQSRQQLQRSLDNLNRTAAAVARSRAQAARGGIANGAGVPDGLTPGGLWAAEGAQAKWEGAKAPQRAWPMAGKSDHRADAVARHPELGQLQRWPKYHAQFAERVRRGAEPRGGASAKPSEIHGAIKADGTVLVVNQNGVIFTGTSQVNAQPGGRRRHHRRAVPRQGHPCRCRRPAAHFKDALGKIELRPGASIATHEPGSAARRRLCAAGQRGPQRRPDLHAARSGGAGGGR